jgi:cold shock CspA family protein
MSASKGWETGTVDWFDELSGEGIIRSHSGEWLFVHRSAIEITPRAQRTLQKNQEVKFKVFRDFHFAQVEKIRKA